MKKTNKKGIRVGKNHIIVEGKLLYNIIIFGGIILAVMLFSLPSTIENLLF